MAWHPSDDGKVVDGKIVVFLRPGRAGDPGEGSASPAPGDPAATGDAGDANGAATAEAPEAGPASSGIRNPRWSTTAAADGDEVEMTADVDPGAKVVFTVERRVGGGPWQPVGSVNARLDGGAARATMRLEHPGDVADVHFRFTARSL